MAAPSRVEPEVQQGKSPSLWTFGGLSLPELVRRTVRESWRDEVFGQGGRMAFYQFLAIFPSLCVCLAVCAHFPRLANHVNDAVRDLGNQVFPARVAQLVQAMMGDFSAPVRFGMQVASVGAAAVWASHNGTWAMIYGLNRAYEVEERRSWWQLTVTIVGLTFCLALTAVVTAVLILGGSYFQRDLHRSGVALHALEWTVLIAALLIAFGVLYRFAPNLRDRKWRWSTPGAVCALILWVAATFLARLYFDHVNDYTRSYGHLNGVVMLLLWLYLSNGALLIGGEMNSEIQKAEAERGRSSR